jgi:hypothetical protein
LEGFSYFFEHGHLWSPERKTEPERVYPWIAAFCNAGL